MATAGAACADREVVANQPAAAVGEDRRTADPTCPLLLVAVGRGASDAAAVRRRAGEDRGAAVAGGIRRAQSGADFNDNAGAQGEVSAGSSGKSIFSGVACPPDAKPPPSSAAGNQSTNTAETLQRNAVQSIERVGIGASKRKFRLKRCCCFLWPSRQGKTLRSREGLRRFANVFEPPD